jgi:hypothetical protein
MTKTTCNRCGLPGPIRWLHAGRDLSRPNSIHQCADRALMRSERPPKCLVHLPDIASVQTCRWPQAGIPPVIEIGANIKSP